MIDAMEIATKDDAMVDARVEISNNPETKNFLPKDSMIRACLLPIAGPTEPRQIFATIA